MQMLPCVASHSEQLLATKLQSTTVAYKIFAFEIIAFLFYFTLFELSATLFKKEFPQKINF